MTTYFEEVIARLHDPRLEELVRERIAQKIGDIVLQPGDTLLVETHPRFLETYRNSPDFFLVSAVEAHLEDGADHAVLRVTDHGIGITPADQKNVFEAFQRGSNVADIPGTGLGLAITKRAVENHGGSIEPEQLVTIERAAAAFQRGDRVLERRR